MHADQTQAGEPGRIDGRRRPGGLLETLDRINGHRDGPAEQRHVDAWNRPQADSPEPAIRGLLESLAAYADWHWGRYGVGIGGRSGILGDAWHELVETAFCLLAGETGRFDMETLRESLHAMLRAEALLDQARNGNNRSSG
ncbi:MAG TPA: hypothetical protein VMY37_36730 [Thermoguttaceae bacterium]|nr:hypothetical protein [Thermoguttaceae bacterium]